MLSCSSALSRRACARARSARTAAYLDESAIAACSAERSPASRFRCPRKRNAITAKETAPASTAAAREDRANLRAASRVGRQEGDGPLDPDRDLLTATLEHRIDVRRTIEALEELFGFFGAETPLLLEILAKMSRAEGQVSREDRNA